MPIVYRFRQTLAALTARLDACCAELVDQHLTDEQAIAFRELSQHDQAHLCRVAQRLITEGDPNEDLIVAALLHDIGKVSTTGRVRLIDRIAKVLLARFAPRILARLTARPTHKWFEGLYLAVKHPAIGAERAAALGCSQRTCWLIAHHEDAGQLDDDALCQLVAADRETV
ncbi:MAG: HD domain-containing protein [Thermomicrobiales bacterium]